MLSYLTRWMSRGAFQALKGASSRPQLVKTPHIGNQTLAVAPLPFTGGSPGVRQARAMDQERLLQIDWDDGSCSLYPFTWLRDNCQCPHCTLQSAQARCLLFTNLDVHTGMDQVQLMDNKVSITWPDQHSSEFDPDWLKKRCFSSEARQAQQEELFLNEREYWDSSLQIPTADFEEVLHDDKAALAWLEALRRIGIVYLRGAPAEQGQVARLSQRIGYLRLTFYGYGLYHHHHHHHHHQNLIKDTHVVDGFHMAEQLRREDPEAFNILSSLRVDFTDSGADYCDFSVQSKNHIIE
uniref:Butyrobetaine (gamma), 2-oxoglutarate dioxygenase (gamma-butyrobetaine hydroxylase) 1 n=1 Tax=Sinocyclocheilus anshuiensis TaxID=1608454 RepID=A0A671T795_9TELE